MAPQIAHGSFSERITAVYSRLVLGVIRMVLPARSALSASIIPVLLFAASAGFVAWRNSQVGVLVDLAYIVNIAMRIALGDVPYAQFPLAQAPGTFLIQAALIKLLGAHYFVQIAYAAIVGGLATALAYAIARRMLARAVAAPHAVALLLSIPLIPLGIYAIAPNPFYDPDACFAVLVAIAAVLVARERPSRTRWLVAGVLLTLPLVIKQNIGGAFLVSAGAILLLEHVRAPVGRPGLRWWLAGVAAGLGIQLVLIQAIIGIGSYVRWAWTYAMVGRGVTITRLREFADPSVIWPSALLLALVILAMRLPPRARGPLFAGGLLVTLVVSLFTPALLLGVPQFFPPFLIASSVLACWRAVRDGPRFDVLLPLVLAATTLGTLQSQGLVNSTFGIFPLLSLAVAAFVRDLAYFVAAPPRLASMTAAVVALILTVVGTGATVGNIRLRFIDADAPGPVMTSTFPSLAGLSARGPYLAELDEILRWMEANVPPGDPFAFLPGEDPVYFALGRKPALPSVYFYDVATPYSPAEIARFADETGLRWVFVKDRLQLCCKPPLEDELVARLTAGATHVTTVGPYRVFRR
jgi:hypothetical protein